MNIFKVFFNVDKRELPFVMSMFGFFSTIITTFWILKPLKKTVFIGFYDKSGLDLGTFQIFDWVYQATFSAAQTEQLAKILNLLFAVFAFFLFTKLSKYFRREKLTYIFVGLCFLIFSYFAYVFQGGGLDKTLNVWVFYLFGDFYSTLMVTTFFAFLHDSVSSAKSKMFYGPIVLGGVVGGVIGTTWVRLWIKQTPMTSWMWICIGISVLMIVFAYIASRFNFKDSTEQKKSEIKAQNEDDKLTLRQVFANRYVFYIAAILGSYEMISVLMDYQFTEVVSHYIDGRDALGQHFSTVYATVSWLSLIVQLFFTSAILQLGGIRKSLLVLPFAVLVTTLGFVAFPLLWVASLLPVFDNGLNYSVHQSAREALYVPLEDGFRYQAKAFIDIFVMRSAKVFSIFLALGVTAVFTEFESLRWLSLLTAGIIGLLIYFVFKATGIYRDIVGIPVKKKDKLKQFDKKPITVNT